MKPQYDFSEGVRGKFFKPDAELRLPVYLKREIGWNGRPSTQHRLVR